MVSNSTDAHCVAKLEIIGTICENMLRAFTFLVHLDTHANIAKRYLTQKPNWTTMWCECVGRLPRLLFQQCECWITIVCKRSSFWADLKTINFQRLWSWFLQGRTLSSCMTTLWRMVPKVTDAPCAAKLALTEVTWENTLRIFILAECLCTTANIAPRTFLVATSWIITWVVCTGNSFSLLRPNKR